MYNSHWQKNFFYCEGDQMLQLCPWKLCSHHTWRCLEPEWTWPWATCSDWPCWCGECWIWWSPEVPASLIHSVWPSLRCSLPVTTQAHSRNHSKGVKFQSLFHGVCRDPWSRSDPTAFKITLLWKGTKPKLGCTLPFFNPIAVDKNPALQLCAAALHRDWGEDLQNPLMMENFCQANSGGLSREHPAWYRISATTAWLLLPC